MIMCVDREREIKKDERTNAEVKREAAINLRGILVAASTFFTDGSSKTKGTGFFDADKMK